MIDIHKGQTEDQESAAKPAEPSVSIGDDDGASKPLPEEPQSLAEHLESAPRACSDETSADPERPPSDVIPDEPEPSDSDEAPAEPEPTASRRDWRSWLSSGWAKFVYFLALVSAVVTIVAYVEGKLGDSAISIPEIRVQLVESVEATYRRQKEAAEAIVGDWQERERQLEAALKQRDAQLQRIHALAEEFQRIASGTDADTIASKLTRILQEQGPSQALDYIETQREDIVARYLADRAANLAKLEPLLASAGLYASEGEAEQARGLYAQIVELAPDWPEALDAHRWFLIDQGDLAMIRGTLDAAERDFALAQHWSAMLAIFDALDQAGMHISPSDRAGLPAIRARVEAISTATPMRNTPAMSPGAELPVTASMIWDRRSDRTGAEATSSGLMPLMYSASGQLVCRIGRTRVSSRG
jgi:tetratricopeptide (TPR) repeat protein